MSTSSQAAGESTPLCVLPCDPKANYLAHRAEIEAGIARVLESGWYILGQEVDAFEQEFAAFLGVRFAIGVGSGTEALHLALRACGVGPGDVVYTVSHTAVATVAAIELAGARPVLVDIDPATYGMDPARLEAAIEAGRTAPPGHSRHAGRPRAILPVHLYGHPAPMPAILEIARRHGLYVVEDCAQSHGAAVDGLKTGSWGHLGAFSFYPTKNLGALGDGGAIVTGDPDLAERVRLLRQYGWRQRYVSERPGTNSRLDELQAAVLRAKLRYLEQENARRRELAHVYDRLLVKSGLATPACQPWAEHVYHQYVVRTPRRDALRSYLRERGIGTLIHYPQAVHQQPAYANRLPRSGELAQSERAAAQVLSLPIYPELPFEQAALVAQAIGEWCAQSP
jgi:dTDP-4-amino-4,6-dideoxygalactose transaminase